MKPPKASRRGRRGAARVATVCLVGLLGLAISGSSGAQPAARARDLVDLALEWARGDFRSPLICEFDGRPRRGLRRVRIVEGPRDAFRRTNELVLFDLEPEDATRCFTELAGEAPNWIGRLRLTHSAPSRPDTALRDFQALLRREEGVDYEIQEGRVREQAIGPPEREAREIDFAGGTMRLERLAPGSDEARLLAEFHSRRLLLLTLEAPDGTRLRLPLMEFVRR